MIKSCNVCNCYGCSNLGTTKEFLYEKENYLGDPISVIRCHETMYVCKIDSSLFPYGCSCSDSKTRKNRNLFSAYIDDVRYYIVGETEEDVLFYIRKKYKTDKIKNIARVKKEDALMILKNENKYNIVKRLFY